MPISPLQEPQYGDKIQLEQAQKAVPLQAAQKAAPPPQPAAPQPPAGGSAAGQVDEEGLGYIDEALSEEFPSPLDEIKDTRLQNAIFRLTVIGNMASHGGASPELIQLFEAAKQDFEELRDENEQKSATEASGERSEGNKAKDNQPKKEDSK